MGAAILAPIIGGHVATDSRPLFDSLLTEILGGGGAPLTARLFISLFVISALGICLRRQVIQLPHLKILSLLLLFFITLVVSTAATQFKYISIQELSGWMVYISTVFVVVMCAGRQTNLKALALALAGGISITAIKGIAEYASFMATEPTHRIFADWTNPNAVASVFAVGALLQLGLTASSEGRTRVFTILGSSLCTGALILTQSKAGYLAFGVGFLAWLVFLVSQKLTKKTFLPLAGIITGVVIAIALTQFASQQSAGSQALQRITQAGSSAEQSVGFRQNLWQSAWQIALKNPIGTGIGTFRQYSAQPGLTDQTVFAHEVYLQLLSEAGWLALLIFAGLAGYWLLIVVRSTKTQPDSLIALKAGILASVVAFGAHGLAESNLSFFGSGLVFFILIGMGLQSATDGSSPEAMPPKIRMTAFAILGGIPLLIMAVNASSEIQKTSLQTAMQSGNVDQVRQISLPLRANPMGDPEALYLGTFDPLLSSKQRLEILSQVVRMNPTPKYLRAAANQAQAEGETEKAIAFLESVDKWDPSNLPAKLLKLKILLADDQLDQARIAAQQLIACEDSHSFKVRAIPEVVPTETYEGRVLLSSITNETDQKITLLTQALQGFESYKLITGEKLKQIRSQLKADSSEPIPDSVVTFANESLEEFKKKMLIAEEAQSQLRRLSKESSTNIDSKEIKRILAIKFDE